MKGDDHSGDEVSIFRVERASDEPHRPRSRARSLRDRWVGIRRKTAWTRCCRVASRGSATRSFPGPIVSRFERESDVTVLPGGTRPTFPARRVEGGAELGVERQAAGLDPKSTGFLRPVAENCPGTLPGGAASTRRLSTSTPVGRKRGRCSTVRDLIGECVVRRGGLLEPRQHVEVDRFCRAPVVPEVCGQLDRAPRGLKRSHSSRAFRSVPLFQLLVQRDRRLFAVQRERPVLRVERRSSPPSSEFRLGHRQSAGRPGARPAGEIEPRRSGAPCSSLPSLPTSTSSVYEMRTRSSHGGKPSLFG